ITYAYRNYGPLGARPEYRLDFQVTCEVFLTFDHVPTVEGWIASLGPSVPANNTRTGVYVSVPVQAGELVGYTDGTRVAGSGEFNDLAWFPSLGREVPQLHRDSGQPDKWAALRYQGL